MESLVRDLEARGASLALEGDGLAIEAPRGVLGPEVIEPLRRHKPELLTFLVARHCECTGEDVAGYLDRNPSRRALLERPALQGWTPAHSVVATCQRYGVALRIDRDGILVVGKAGAKADEATQPWSSLLAAIEAHADAVARLVEAGWHLCDAVA
jgi:hypothetical protein